MTARNFLVASLLLAAWPLLAASKQKRRRSSTGRNLVASVGPTEDAIWDSGLLEKECSSASVYEKGRQYFQDTTIKKFPGRTLGYVTPWHRRGYDLAVIFRAKLSHVSPVWYQLKRYKATERNGKGNSGYYLDGGHEVNQTWMQALREPVVEGAPATKVVPRVILELAQEDLLEMLTKPKGALAAIASEVAKHNLDGVVFEAMLHWIMVNGMNNPQFRESALKFVERLALLLHDPSSSKVSGEHTAVLQGQGRKELILAVPPAVPAAHNRPFVDKSILRALAPFVDGWSIMTYDYADGATPGPNSPLTWAEQNIKALLQMGDSLDQQYAPNLWLGINFYGYDFNMNQLSSEAITMDAYMKLLNEHQPSLKWEEEHAEHSFTYDDAKGLPHTVYFPTARSMQMRLEKLAAHGLGASMWELGQGLERFFDLL